jgi:hypothetical protein
MRPAKAASKTRGRRGESKANRGQTEGATLLAELRAEGQPTGRRVVPQFEMVATYALWYNWIRIHKTLRVTPAMAAGLSQTIIDWLDIIEEMDADTPPKKRGPYKKAVA